MSLQDEFAEFCRNFPQKRKCDPRNDEIGPWMYREVFCNDSPPVVFVSGIYGSSNCFFSSAVKLHNYGYNCLICTSPEYTTPSEFNRGLLRFLEPFFDDGRGYHFFASDLGAMMIQYFAAQYPKKVQSLILCNGFASTYPFCGDQFNRQSFQLPTDDLIQTFVEFFEPRPNLVYSSVVYVVNLLLPGACIKKLFPLSLPRGRMSEECKEACDFVEKDAENFLSGEYLQSTLQFIFTPWTSSPDVTHSRVITLIEGIQQQLVPDLCLQEMKQLYPSARRVNLQTGDFPYLSRADETVLHCIVHLRACGHWPVPHSPQKSLKYRDIQRKTIKKIEEKKFEEIPEKIGEIREEKETTASLPAWINEPANTGELYFETDFL